MKSDTHWNPTFSDGFPIFFQHFWETGHRNLPRGGQFRLRRSALQPGPPTSLGVCGGAGWPFRELSGDGKTRGKHSQSYLQPPFVSCFFFSDVFFLQNLGCCTCIAHLPAPSLRVSWHLTSNGSLATVLPGSWPNQCGGDAAGNAWSLKPCHKPSMTGHN